MRNIAATMAVMAIVVASSAYVLAMGVKPLTEVGKSMADIGKAMDEETRAFDRVKAALSSGAIKKGMPQSEIRSKYGEPVIANDDYATRREKWVYKPASSTFFKGIRVYLFFTDEGELDEIKILS